MICILEFLENKQFWEYSNWLAIKANKILDTTMHTGIAPAKTSIHTKSRLKYYHLPVNKFSILGSFIGAEKSLLDFFDGKMLNKASINSIPRLTIKEAKELYTKS